jgi:hypothetical protein
MSEVLDDIERWQARGRRSGREETAVAIVAEIIECQAHVPVSSLRDGSAPIHQVFG